MMNLDGTYNLSMLLDSEGLLGLYRSSHFVETYDVTQTEYLYLYKIWQDTSVENICDLFECFRAKLYRLQNKLFKKIGVSKRHQALRLFLECEILNLFNKFLKS